MHWYMENNKLPKGFPVREREALLSELRELLRIARMESANFDNHPLGREIAFDPQKPTEYVREITRLWRNSWLVHPLEKLIARYEAG